MINEYKIPIRTERKKCEMTEEQKGKIKTDSQKSKSNGRTKETIS